MLSVFPRLKSSSLDEVESIEGRLTADYDAQDSEQFTV